MGAQSYGISLRVFDNEWDIEYYFVCCINILLIKKADLTHVLKQRTHCQSVMALARVTDMSAANWLSRVVIRFFSGVGIPIKHSSLYNKRLLKTQ